MKVICVNSFTKNGGGGNPAGVAILESRETDSRMQHIAKAVGYSETVFIIEGNDGYNFRFFTPTSEVDLCGHATIAALSVLNSKTSITVNTKAGKVKTYKDGDQYNMTQVSPIFGEVLGSSIIADLLNISKTCIINKSGM